MGNGAMEHTNTNHTKEKENCKYSRYYYILDNKMSSGWAGDTCLGGNDDAEDKKH